MLTESIHETFSMKNKNDENERQWFLAACLGS
jgi:hypothetical protein